MKEFTEIERQAFHDIEKLKDNLKIVHNSESDVIDIYAQLTAELKLSEPDIIQICNAEGGAAHYTSSTPIGTHILKLAADATCEASRIQEQVLEHQCRSIVSFPERLANKAAETSQLAYRFNAELYWERLCDTVLLLYFTRSTTSQDAMGVLLDKKKLEAVLGKIMQSLTRRGNMHTITQRFLLLPRSCFDANCFRTQLPHLLAAILEACEQRRFSFKSKASAEVTPMLHQWNVLFFSLVDKRPELKDQIVISLGEILTARSTEKSARLAEALFQSIFVQSFFFEASARNSVRVAMTQLLPLITGDVDEDKKYTAREHECFAAILSRWDNKEFVTSGNLHANLALLHPVMYILLYVRKKYPDEQDFPSKYVGALLNGVSLRLGSTRGEDLRMCALTVAAAFATLFVDNTDDVSPLLQDVNYSRALEHWMKDEQSVAHGLIASVAASVNVEKQLERCSILERRAVSQPDAFPLDPDEPYSFFTAPADRNNTESRAIAKVQKESGLANPQKTFAAAELPSFGQQKFPQDELDEHVSILGSIRECYNALVGVGRNPNTQLHEVQESIESGLRGLNDAFAKLRERMDSELFRAISKETGPLIPILLPALISLSIHAPDAQKELLLQLRYSVLVSLIMLNPLLCLGQLSGMIYRGNYGIYQRNELIKTMGEAAFRLSKVEVIAATPSAHGAETEKSGLSLDKRIYPPIPRHQLSGEQKTAIVVTEGQQTRRWGNAVVGRSEKQLHLKRYTNMLGDVAAAFVAALLFKIDADHFSFFQESDPYTPCAILDSLTIVFQGITNVRHIAPELCEKNFDFFFAVSTKHPNLTVRKAGWTSIVEVMRTWCGVAPLWIRKEDGQRVFNRDASLHRSLMFTKSWLNALELLHHACEKMLHASDSCARTALIAVSNLRELVCDRDDFKSMLAQCEGHSIAI